MASSSSSSGSSMSSNSSSEEEEEVDNGATATTTSASAQKTTGKTSSAKKPTSFVSRFKFENLKKFKGVTMNKIPGSKNPNYPQFTLEFSLDGTNWSCYDNCAKQTVDSKGNNKLKSIIESKEVKMTLFSTEGKPDVTMTFEYAPN